MKAAMERKAIEHIIALITGGYRENPNLLTGPPGYSSPSNLVKDSRSVTELR